MMIHGMHKTRFYNIWRAMRSRCNSKTNYHYSYYGGKGIKVAAIWEKFENFKADMYKDYLTHCNKFGEKNTTLDRINVNGDYCKKNCQWATMAEQNRNKNYNVRITYNGKTLILKDWAKEIRINYDTLMNRLSRGWTIEKAFSEKTLFQKRLNREKALEIRELYKSGNETYFSLAEKFNSTFTNIYQIVKKKTWI